MPGNRACTSGSDRYATSFHAASLCSESRNTTKLVPPATDAPGPSGPGSGIVIHASDSDDGRRLRNSAMFRSEEHTSELQSLMRISYAVFCLKKKKKNKL